MISATVLPLLSAYFEQQLTSKNILPISGGSINETGKIVLKEGKTFFFKINSASKFPHLFQREKEGLELLASSLCIKVPHVQQLLITEKEQVLIMEWVESGVKDKTFWKLFGEQLAKLHATSNPLFGLTEDNYMGNVYQQNKHEKDWVTFFREHRLIPLIKQCSEINLLPAETARLFDKVIQRLPEVFEEEKPALVHGDLWSGNYLCNREQQPVLIDPAAYYGHRSVDLAMTTLFGTFDKTFYQAYHYHYPLPVNFGQQWQVCNLYPLLIHLRLFGRSYLSSIEQILKMYQ